jgi:hypothetical protein
MLACLVVVATNGACADTIDYADVMRAIAQDIAALRHDYPQLAQFQSDRQIGGEMAITYTFHTHAAAPGGGWTSGVPNPDDDGIWFYLDFHDPQSTAQIHTQPVIAAQCIGDKRVSLLILEGRTTRSVEGEIQKILRHHGVGRCERPRHASGPTARIT